MPTLQKLTSFPLRLCASARYNSLVRSWPEADMQTRFHNILELKDITAFQLMYIPVRQSRSALLDDLLLATRFQV